MTTTSAIPHTHPELQSGIDTTQAMIAQLIAGQATILDTLNAQAESQARMQDEITTMQVAITTMQSSITALIDSQVQMQTAIGELQMAVGELQMDVGELARGLAVVQADEALLLARDS